MSDKKIVVAGASGMLGFDLLQRLAELSDSDTIVGLGRAELDVTKLDSIHKSLDRHEPWLVVNASGYTNVDGAETEKAAAWAINAEGPRNLATSCAARGIRLVHFSTDQVFDGTGDRPRSEDEKTNPANYYATSKLAGEQAALEYPEALVLRVQWLYGLRKDRFTTLKDKAVFTPFADQIGAPTWTHTLATDVVELVTRRVTGLFHYAYDDFASWAQVFEFVKERLNLNVRLEPKLTQEVALPAKRPLFSVMSNEKIKRALGRTTMGSWKRDLSEFLELASRL